MFVPSGSLPIASTSAPSGSKASGRSRSTRRSHSRRRFANRTGRSREALEHVLEIAVDGDADVVDLAAAGCGRVEQRLDLFFGVGELAPVAVEELDAVVLRRVVRRRDDDAEVEPEQRDRRRRHDACQHGAAGRCDTARERLLELLARGARVAADEDAAAPGPERRRLAQLLDELGRHELAHDAADSIGAEVAPRHGAGG